MLQVVSRVVHVAFNITSKRTNAQTQNASSANTTGSSATGDSGSSDSGSSDGGSSDMSQDDLNAQGLCSSPRALAILSHQLAGLMGLPPTIIQSNCSGSSTAGTSSKLAVGPGRRRGLSQQQSQFPQQQLLVQREEACSNPGNTLRISLTVEAAMDPSALVQSLQGAMTRLQSESPLFWTPDVGTVACPQHSVSL